LFKGCWELEVMFSPKSNCEVEGGVVSCDWVLRVECFCSLLALTYDVFQAKQLTHPGREKLWATVPAPHTSLMPILHSSPKPIYEAVCALAVQ